MSEQITNHNIPGGKLSDSWLKKFNLLAKIGADEQFIFKAMSGDKFKDLPFIDRQKITLNIFAFFFGPLYYFSKKMWHKGALLLAVTWLWACLLFLVELLADIALANIAYWIVPAVLCAQLANYDYFRFISQKEKVWQQLPAIFTGKAGVISSPLIAFSLLIGLTLGLTPAKTPECYNSEVTEMVIDLAKNEALNRLAIKKTDRSKPITIR